MTLHRLSHELPTEIPLRCWCGRLHGTALGVEPKAGCRVVCYCDDCQAFAQFLKRPGITDDWGGTDVFQVAPANLRILDPTGALACVRLTAKGMYRWYCGECKTPVGNTVSARVPFVGLIHAFMDHESEGRPRDEVLGKPGYSQAKFAAPGLPRDRRGLPLGVIAKSVTLLGKWWLQGAGSPSPFFEGPEHTPRVTPSVLSPEERLVL